MIGAMWDMFLAGSTFRHVWSLSSWNASEAEAGRIVYSQFCSIVVCWNSFRDKS